MVRDKQGRFVKGHAPMGGRPPRAKEQRYYEILITAVSLDDWNAIIGRAVTDAKKGDQAARKWLADYIIGPPVERKELTGDSGGPMIFKIIYDNK